MNMEADNFSTEYLHRHGNEREGYEGLLAYLSPMQASVTAQSIKGEGQTTKKNTPKIQLKGSDVTDRGKKSTCVLLIRIESQRMPYILHN